MKTWIKRSLIGLAAAGALFGGIAAFADRQGGGPCGHMMMGMHDPAAMKARFIERAARHLDLDAAQKAKLGALADKMQEQRQALMGGAAQPGAQLQGLIAGATFDRAKASELVAAKMDAIKTGSPGVIDAMANFYDSLKPEQQAKLREFMTRHHRGGERGGERGEHDQPAKPAT
ncbi:MAG: Spy/CpxP family protein refolding chaperone [Burkholderiales bacterium]|nr:Spy/CpxP family protein refolding chaperone [Burkholderiales bacterium]MDE2398859.1 Spy/CpxP family protein refolding chaperone [Burkholderiales bacterium]MDE2455298.1 Spy/CpxP family protein refolding chaperone [Burkholderiales bacterium]